MLSYFIATFAMSYRIELFCFDTIKLVKICKWQNSGELIVPQRLIKNINNK